MNCKVIKIKITSVFFFLIDPIVTGIRKRKAFIELTMRIFILLFSTALLGLTPKHVLSQNDKIVIAVDQELSVDQIFKIIKAQTDYRFIYYGDLFKDFPKVSLKKGTIRLNKLLDQSLSAGHVHIIFTANNNILIKALKVQQQLTVKGTVTDESGLPIPGATVLIKGTTRGTATNLDGHYSLTVPDPANVLVFSSLGFNRKEIMVGNHLPAGLPSQRHGQAGTIINVVLNEDISQLDEVTINAGYYKTTERERTGSISKIDAKTIEKQPVSNPLAAMQGYIPGVNITQDSGIPGSGFNIEIRGKNFINAGTNPLYIVDGVPFSSEALGDLSSVKSVITRSEGRNNISPLNLINPADIESIEVLKDADATAIYGSRGANGVVLITTKKGKTGKTQIKLNIITSMASVPKFVDLLNTEQYLEMRHEALTNNGYTLESLPDNIIENSPDLYLWDQNRYTDWQKVLIGGTAYRNTAELSISGGSEQTRFLFGGSYQNESTVFIGDSKYGKASVRSNITHQSIDKRFKVNVTTNYVADDKIIPTERFTSLAYQLPPNAPALYNDEGNLNWENSTWTNPLASLNGKFRTQSNNLFLNSVLSHHPIPNLEFKANLGYTNFRMELYNTFPHTIRDPASGSTSEKGSFSYTNNVSSQSWIVEPQINWNNTYGKFRLNTLLGTTFQQKITNQMSHRGSGFPSNSQILDLSAATSVRITRDWESEYRYHAVFGRLNFTWDNKYIMNLTGRRDGSSRFGPGRKFGNFWAIGMAWLFSKETFLEENSLLSFGKLRSSYGITGSDANIGDYGFYNTYITSEGDYDGSGLLPTRLFNPNFGWEENKKFEVALELGFFKDRFMLTTAWYRNRSSNQLIGIPLPDTTGFDTLNANFDATVQNTGFEVDFRSINIENNAFKWITTFNISVPRNKLVKFDALETSTFRNTYAIGEPLTIDKLYHITGVDKNTGVYQFEDYNGDGIINAQNDLKWIVDTAPKFYGGLNNTLNYKNWTLDAFFQFKKHKASVGQLFRRRPGIFSNMPIPVLNRWQEQGDEASIQRYTLGIGAEEENTVFAFSRYTSSNAMYTDASFIRLRNVTLIYALPKDVLPGLNASVYFQGQNLMTISKFKGSDPDQVDNPNGYLPLLRQFTMGLRLGF